MACGRRTISNRVMASFSERLEGEGLEEEVSGNGTSCCSSASSEVSKSSSSTKSASSISASRTSSSSPPAWPASLSSSSEAGNGTLSIVSSSSRESMTGSSSASVSPSASVSTSASGSGEVSSGDVAWKVDVFSSNTSIPRVSLSTPASSKRPRSSAFLPDAERSFKTQSALSFATVRLVVGSSPMVLPQQTVGLMPFKAGVDLMTFCIKYKA